VNAKTLTVMPAVRFLTDCLQGGPCMKAASPDRDLLRARAQMQPAADVEKIRSVMQALSEKKAGGNHPCCIKTHTY